MGNNKANRFFACPITKGILQLSSPEAHHLAAVMRLNPGDTIELFDGQGTSATAQIIHANTRKTTVEVKQIQKTPPRTSGRIILAVSLAKGERFDWLISKATEIGVDHICPIIYQRTVKLAKNAKILDRYQKLTSAAAKQSRRLFLPQIDPPAPLTDALNNLKTTYPHPAMLTGSLTPQAQPLTRLPFNNQDTIAFIGPEGGMTDDEENFLNRQGALPVRLTDTILRIETAALTFAAILAAQRHAQ